MRDVFIQVLLNIIRHEFNIVTSILVSITVKVGIGFFLGFGAGGLNTLVRREPVFNVTNGRRFPIMLEVFCIRVEVVSFVVRTYGKRAVQ